MHKHCTLFLFAEIFSKAMYIKSLFFAIHKIPLNKKKKETYTFLKSRRQSVMV